MDKKASEVLLKLPPSRIVIVDGKVRQVEEWTLWNGTPWMTIKIRRETDPQIIAERGEFFSSIGDPEHGGGSSRGTLAEVTAGLHEKFRAQYKALFALEDADETSVKRLDGFDKYEVEVQATA